MSTTHTVHHVIRRPWESLIIFMVAFFVLAVILFSIDFVPEPVATTVAAPVATPTVTVSQVAQNTHVANVNLIAGPSPAVTNVHGGAAPTRIVIAKVGVDTTISNPTSTKLAVLDQELLKGAVHYPGTAYLGEQGSVLLFGHQSYLPIVHNSAFKAFNDLQKLESGDLISVYGDGKQYQYKVRSVTLVTVDFGNIPLETEGATLTLVTCNSLGEKEQRYIIKADFIGII